MRGILHFCEVLYTGIVVLASDVMPMDHWLNCQIHTAHKKGNSSEVLKSSSDWLNSTAFLKDVISLLGSPWPTKAAMESRPSAVCLKIWLYKTTGVVLSGKIYPHSSPKVNKNTLYSQHLQLKLYYDQ